MARASKRPRLVLTIEEKQYVDQLSQSRTAAVREHQRGCLTLADRQQARL
jgi:hypothetical protein